MIYLIKKETTIFTPFIDIKEKDIGYYECENEDDVITYCKNKEEEEYGTYDEDVMSESYYYIKLAKLN